MKHMPSKKYREENDMNAEQVKQNKTEAHKIIKMHGRTSRQDGNTQKHSGHNLLVITETVLCVKSEQEIKVKDFDDLADTLV